MTSLAEAYEENVGEVGSVRRLYLGVGLFVAGALLVVLGIVMSTTSVHAAFGLEYWQGREIAGVLAGLGVPAVFVGIFSVLPASQRVRAAAAIGAGIAVLGVALFTHAYPYQWAGVGEGPDFTFQVVAVYFLGVLVTFWCLFVAVANFKTRNDPGGTVKLEITKDGETRIVEVSNDRLRGTLGGIGVLGGTPDGDVDTQTNRESSTGGGSTNRSSGGRGGTAEGVTDGGATTTDDAEFLTGDSGEPTSDTYCGNCSHFQYVRTDGDIEPYCGYHGELMDDMDACEEWTPNTGR